MTKNRQAEDIADAFERKTNRRNARGCGCAVTLVIVLSLLLLLA